jgi:hypothetical protein
MKQKIFEFNTNETADSFARKIGQLSAEIHWGVKNNKTFKVIVVEEEDETQNNIY